MPVTSCHDILVTPHAEFCGNTFVFRQVSVEVIDGVKGIVFVFSERWMVTRAQTLSTYHR